MCERFEHTGPIRSVVLIDEIDKAPRDVPNDLLAEVENMRFFVSELDRTVAADPAMRPILVITSNSEKALPDAFLRRCVYYHIPFPADDELREIVASRIAALPRDSDLVGDAIVLFGYVRHARQRLRKNPALLSCWGSYRPARSRIRGRITTCEAVRIGLISLK